MEDRTTAGDGGGVDDGRTLEYAYDGETPASIAVVQALCAIENVDPVDAPADLGVTLYDHINPEALDAMVADGEGKGEVLIELTIGVHRVLVEDTGRILVRPNE